MDGFEEEFEIVSLFLGCFKQAGSGSLAGEEEHFAIGAMLARRAEIWRLV